MWRTSVEKKAQKLKKDPPSTTEINDAMLPAAEPAPAPAPVQEQKPKRGRPRTAHKNDDHLHIKCPKKVGRKFRVLAAMHGVEFAVLLEQALETFEAYADIPED